jgi:uncharacterized protein YndB with AHSA1/START domain
VISDDAVVHELVVPAPPDEVFDMFVRPDELVRWIGISADLDPRPDGCFRFEIVPGQFCEGRYVELDRPRRVVFTWGWTDPTMNVPPGSSRVEVTFEPWDEGRSTALTLVHEGLDADARLMHDDGWTSFLARLDAVVRGGPAPGYPSADPQQRLRELKGEDHGG